MYYRYALSALHCFAWNFFDLRDIKVVAGKYYNYEDVYDYREQVSFLI